MKLELLLLWNIWALISIIFGESYVLALSSKKVYYFFLFDCWRDLGRIIWILYQAPLPPKRPLLEPKKKKRVWFGGILEIPNH
jgi:hypothetical protein